MNTKFNYGDSVIVVKIAPKHYRPGEYASICSIRLIETSEIQQKFNEPLGTVLYHVEFGDGSSIEVPEKYLELYK